MMLKLKLNSSYEPVTLKHEQWRREPPQKTSKMNLSVHKHGAIGCLHTG